MKVLFLNYEYPPLGGGAANATKQLLLEYARRSEVEVDLVTSATDNQERTEVLAENVRIHFLAIGNKQDALHHQSIFNLLWYSFLSYQKSVELLRQEKYDVVHAFFGVPCGAIALALKIRFGIPYIVSLRGSDVPGYSARFRFLYPFLRPIIRAIWKRARVVVANSEGLKDLALTSAPRQSISVIPNGVDVVRFAPNPDLRPKDEVVVTVGATRITERKGIRYLLEAVNILKEKFPQLVLEIMGDGSARKELEDLVVGYGLTGRVRFLGRIDADKTNLWYKRASIFVLPSLNEGMSNALLEALASGLPAVVTNTGGSHELVTENVNGKYIEKKSAASIVSALTALLENKEEREQMGMESRKRAETLSWEKVASSYIMLYKN